MHVELRGAETSITKQVKVQVWSKLDEAHEYQELLQARPQTRCIVLSNPGIKLVAVMAFHISRMWLFITAALSPSSQSRTGGVKCHRDAAPDDESFSFHQKLTSAKRDDKKFDL